MQVGVKANFKVLRIRTKSDIKIVPSHFKEAVIAVHTLAYIIMVERIVSLKPYRKQICSAYLASRGLAAANSQRNAF